MNDPIEELKRKKMEEMMRKQNESQSSERKIVLTKLASAGARERINNLRLTKPEIAQQLEEHLVNLYKMGQIRPVVTEEQIVKILDLLIPKKDFRISRR